MLIEPAGAEWTEEARSPPLEDRDVHVWRVPLRLPASLLEWGEALLDPDERERAARYRFVEHRVAFVSGRAIQRDILSRYLEIDPAQVRYRVSQHGKPELSPESAGAGVRFNFSNSGELGLLAVTRGRDVGVDVEQVRHLPDALEIARGFFSGAEAEVLRRTPAEQRDLAFFHCWTRKEAYIKAVGAGLAIPLDCFDVAFAPGEPAALLQHRDRPAEVQRWIIRHLEVEGEYVGALAIERDRLTLRRLQWRPRVHLDGE